MDRYWLDCGMNMSVVRYNTIEILRIPDSNNKNT